MLWGVMDSKFLLSPFPFDMVNKLLPSVLTSTVRVKDTNVGIMLGSDRSFVLLVCMEGVAFVFKEVEISEVGFVICKADIVPAPFDCSDGCRPP